MNYLALREELRDFYKNRANPLAEEFYSLCQEKYALCYEEAASAFSMKSLLYKTISENVTPVLFENNPFYYETGTLRAKCSGAHWTEGKLHAGTLLYQKRESLFRDYNPEAHDRFLAQMEEKRLYRICGPYCDITSHFPLYMRSVLKKGLSGIYDELMTRQKEVSAPEQKEFLACAAEGLLAIKAIQKKFEEEAVRRFEAATDPAKKKHWERIISAARQAPWLAPTDFYQALASYALMRNCVATLDAVSIESFGRLDVDLYPFYKKGIEDKTLTQDEAYALICQFLITWDLHFDHDETDGGLDINDTFTVGGCDADGNPVCNDVTLMLLRAHRAQKIITPKIMCRFSDTSAKEYLDVINQSILDGGSSISYTNDNLIINAQLKNGRPLADARDYLVVGCWEISTCEKEKADVGTYFNLLKPLEFAIHNKKELLEGTGLQLSALNGNESFEQVYRTILDNIRIIFEERAAIIEGRCVWKDVSPLALYSAFIHSCIEKAKDFTDGGAVYNDDQFLCFGFPDLVDSLLAIKQLCFDEKRCTLGELLLAVGQNWKDADHLRSYALRCNSWGDESKESVALATRLHNDLYQIIQNIPYSYMRDRLGGTLTMGHLSYNESILWGARTLATPNGRYNGGYISQGLAPTNLNEVLLTSAINSASVLEEAQLSANSVLTVVFPTKKMDLNIIEAIVRTAAKCHVGSLQLNCMSKQELLDAQNHPERYPNLIVRVCGFSAKFVSLSKTYQDYVISKYLPA